MEISLIFNTVSHRQNISMGYFIGKKVTDKQTNSNFINIDYIEASFSISIPKTPIFKGNDNNYLINIHLALNII